MQAIAEELMETIGGVFDAASGYSPAGRPKRQAGSLDRLIATFCFVERTAQLPSASRSALLRRSINGNAP